MTTIYFVRHALPNYDNHNDAARELTEKGLEDRKLVSKYLEDKNIDIVISSPYKRAVDTVKHFVDGRNLPIETVDDFRERTVDSVWIEDFETFCKNQWDDFSYKLADGETLAEVQERNVRALMGVLEKYPNKNIVIGSHGTALGVILNYFDKSFGYDGYTKIRTLMPWVLKMVFSNKKLQKIEMVDLFE